MTLRPLIFLHIPRSAGIALSHTLITAEKPRSMFFGFDRALFGGFTDFDSIPADNRALIHLSADTIPRDETMLRAFMALSTLRAAYPGARFMTVLREPVCRLISHYIAWRGMPDARAEEWGAWAAYPQKARASLEHFLTDPDVAAQIDNIATRLLLWPNPLLPDAAMIEHRNDAALLQQALARLRTLDFADSLENPYFDAHFAAWLGTSPARGRMNEAAPLPPALRTRLDQELTPRAQSALAARTRLDVALWQSLLPPDVDGAALRLATIQRFSARAALLLAGFD